ncbi:MAG: peptidoglycan-associated lipoprotein Pal [Myxococcales bacterium]|nr:MAG: peptidoglycan-associated lipoprotein Pal [Myxococcales bacterium]
MTNKIWGGALLLLAGAALFVSVMFVAGCADPPKPAPLPECDDDLDCPEGKRCEGGRCVVKIQAARPECTSDADCPDNKICVNGKCQFECTVDSDCGPNHKCVNNRCVRGCEVQTVHFDFDEYYLTAEAQAILRANVACIKEKGVVKVTIEGHCDERGSIEYNLSLGQKRAQSVRNFLVDLGIDRKNVKIISYGEERPLDPASTEDAWAKNRRGETVLP